jgi:hypothetical protein
MRRSSLSRTAPAQSTTPIFLVSHPASAMDGGLKNADGRNVHRGGKIAVLGVDDRHSQPGRYLR